jgi:hypothetical protein
MEEEERERGGEDRHEGTIFMLDRDVLDLESQMHALLAVQNQLGSVPS